MRDRMTLLGMNMAPRSHRRWLVGATYAVLLLACLGVLAHAGDRGVGLMAMCVVINGVVLGGYGRAGLIKPFVDKAPLDEGVPQRNDERDRQLRDQMHFNAYRVVVPVLLLGFVLGGPPFQQPEWSRALLVLGMVLGLTLPQAMLLWSEPDPPVGP